MVDKTITRTDLLNFLAEKYKLRRYLEIGIQNRSQNFDKIKCFLKHGVDPDINSGATHMMTSDEFFEYNKDHSQPDKPVFVMYDLVFIDGLHTAEQVRKDFMNALNVLSPNGWIVLHDTNPETYERTIVPRPTPSGPWNGDVYKFAVGLENHCAYTVSIDNGCTVYSNTKGVDTIIYKHFSYLNWDFFDEQRKELLNLITWDEFITSHSHL